MRWMRWVGALAGVAVFGVVVGTAWAYFRPESRIWGFRLQTALQELQISAVADNPAADSFATQAELSFSAELVPGAAPLLVPFWVRNISSGAQGLELFGQVILGDQDWAVLAPHIELRVSSQDGATAWHSLQEWSTAQLGDLTFTLPGSWLEAGAQRKYVLEFRLPITGYTSDTQGRSTGNFGFQVMGRLWEEAQQ